LRIALISTGQKDEEPGPRVAGRSLILRQLDFARACGAERIIAHGNGVLEDATVLSDAARKAGVSFSVIASAHALIPLVGLEDSLLVLQPRILPEAPEAIIALEAGPAVLAFPARDMPGKPFERIDGDTYWAGALLMPGELIARLEELPEDADPPAALLRIALQEGVRRTRLDQRMLAEGLWGRLLPDSDHRKLGAARLQRAGSPIGGLAQLPSARLAALALRYCADFLLAHRHLAPVLLLLALITICAGPVAALFGLAAPAFAAIAGGGLLLELAFGLQRIALPAFQSSTLPRRLRYLPDLAILITGILAIEGTWYHRLFPPIVLCMALIAIGRNDVWRSIVSDRVLGTALVALAAIPSWHEPALMVWALAAVIIAVWSVPHGGTARGVTLQTGVRGAAPQRSDTGT